MTYYKIQYSVTLDIKRIMNIPDFDENIFSHDQKEETEFLFSALLILVNQTFGTLDYQKNLLNLKILKNLENIVCMLYSKNTHQNSIDDSIIDLSELFFFRIYFQNVHQIWNAWSLY